MYERGRRDHMVVGFTTVCTISMQLYVIKFVSTLQQVGRFLWSPSLIKVTAMK
jgi:hypothetical protein